MTRIDPRAFCGFGAVADLTGRGPGGLHVEKWPTTHARDAGPALERLRERGVGPVSIQLRWVFAATLGYPLAPFTVLVREPRPPRHRVTPDAYHSGEFTQVFLRPADSRLPWVDVWAQVEGPGGTGFASDAPLPGGSLTSPVALSAGLSTARFTGPDVRWLALPAGTVVREIRAHDASVVDDDGWRELEIVGLPGDGRAAQRTDLTSPQGRVTDPLHPVDAALDRYRRGAPAAGWPAAIPGTAAPAPPWLPADPEPIVKLFHAELLGAVVSMVDGTVPSQQHLREFEARLPAPTGDDATGAFNPLRVLLYGAMTDPAAALLLGLGTAFDLDDEAWDTAVLKRSGVRPDFQVRAVFATDDGEKVEWAAPIMGPAPALPPGPPAALTATVEGFAPPEHLDDDRTAVVTLSWRTPMDLFGLPSAAYATARELPPGGVMESLLAKRPGDEARQPIGGTFREETPRQRSAGDATWRLRAESETARYAVTAQSLWGQWSAWVSTQVTAAEPPAGAVTLTGPDLAATAPAGPDGRCPATLSVRVGWDFATRSPARIVLAGRLFGQAHAPDRPADGSVPAGVFAGAGATAAAGELVALDVAGDTVTATAAPGLHAEVELQDGSHPRGPRTYLVTLTGLRLDFAAHSRWGMALWARGTEARAPQRTGPWTADPPVASAADPRPPVGATVYDAVRLASLRDADGLHHAGLTWDPMAGAAGYVVYGTAESRFRQFHGLDPARQWQTLSDRMTQLRDAFRDHPDRTPFTRLNDTAVPGTALPVTLPRGTKEIHLFLVLGVSAGEVESAWPTTADDPAERRGRLLGIAAPAVVVPIAPALEVARAALPGGGSAARLRVTASPGPRATRIEIHRVRVAGAVADVDMMGPPVATLTASPGGGPALTDGAATWTVTPVPAPPGADTDPLLGGIEQPLGRCAGVDPVPPSWRGVWYRAVAWTDDDPDRGILGGRSAPSVPRTLVVPPDAPPDLGGPLVHHPVAASPGVRLELATTEPLTAGPLGPHTLTAVVTEVGADGARTPFGDVAPATLDALPATAPPEPAPGAAAWWRGEPAGGRTPVFLALHRAHFDHALDVRVRLTDPLGRMTERTVTVPAGVPAAAAPDLSGVAVEARPGGWVLGFTTTAPNTDPAGAEPYRLVVRVVRDGVKRPTVVDLPLARLPYLPKDGDLFSNPKYVVPVAGGRRRGGVRTVVVGLRAPCTVTVALVAPGGAATEITRTVGRTP